MVPGRVPPPGQPGGLSGSLELFLIDTSPFMGEYQLKAGANKDQTCGTYGDCYDWRGLMGGPKARAVATLRELRAALASSNATYKVRGRAFVAD